MVYYLNENIINNVPYTANKFLTHKFDDEHILVTTDHGSWIVLSKNEYDLLIRNKINEDPHLFDVLEERGIIITEKNTNDMVDTCKQRFNYLFNGINLHIIVPTLRCNQNCIYCHALSKDINSKEYDMDETTAKAVVDFIFQSPSKFLNIEFQGGEPLLNFPIVKYIVDYTKEKNKSPKPDERGWYTGDRNISFMIVTNLTLMDEDILNYITENKIRVCTSLDGPKELHDRNRPCRNGNSSYDDAVKWIEIIKRRGIQISAIPTITKHSLPYAKEIVDEYIKRGFDHTRMRELNIAGMAINAWDKIGYTPEEFIKFWKDYLQYVIDLNSMVTKFWDETTSFILSRILCKKSTFNACLNSPCGVGTIQCAYNERGDIYTCDEARSNETFRLGNVKSNSYKEVFTSENVSSFISLSSCLSSSCESCVWHAFCSPCLVSAYGETGTLVPRFPNFVCKIRGEQTKEVFRRLLSKDREIITKWVRPER
ncbi:MAG: His-Xaa-Ser system radical SAM maturase HxsB [Candidatus Aenigmatarchaeota archaeon]